MEQISRGQQQHHQQRSHSIGGQDFHLNGSYQRLKQSTCPQPGMPDDQYHSLMHPASRNHMIPSPYLHQVPQHHTFGRSPSPISTSSQVHYSSSQRDNVLRHSNLDRQPRNQLHASLECLNSNFSDYQHHTRQHQPQQHNLQTQIQNQHYAASYVLAPPPANTVINQNGDQDLAAAAMGGGLSSQQHSQYSQNSTNSHSYCNQTNNLLSRALAQVSHSPFRRMTSSSIAGNSHSSSLLAQVSGSNHAIRAGHSSLSLASSSYILEDKLQNEIRKLQSELKTEKEKSDALNSQLNINSSLMAAFEQSLTTLNTRLRQLTTLNEKKDNEIAELRDQLSSAKFHHSDEDESASKSPSDDNANEDSELSRCTNDSERDNDGEQNNLIKIIEDLKRKLIEKDRLLTDTRLEALSAAHQLEQLESKLNGEHSLLVTEEDLDEGVTVNHSPSESDATTDSAHFSEMNNQITKSAQLASQVSGISIMAEQNGKSVS